MFQVIVGLLTTIGISTTPVGGPVPPIDSCVIGSGVMGTDACICTPYGDRVTTDIAPMLTKALTVLACIGLLAIPAANAAPPKAPDAASVERSCRILAGRESVEGEGRSHEGQLNVERYSNCLLGIR